MILLQDLAELEEGAANVVNNVGASGYSINWFDGAGVTEMMLRFGFFLVVLFGIVYYLYYRKTHRRD